MKGWIIVWRAFQGWEDMAYALALAEDVDAGGPSLRTRRNPGLISRRP